MPKNGALKDIEREYGKPFEEVLLQVLNEQRTEMAAAITLRVFPGTIRWHRERYGIVKRDKRWVVAEDAHDHTN